MDAVVRVFHNMNIHKLLFLSENVSWNRVVKFHDMKSAMVFFAKPKPWKQQFQHKISPQLNAKIRDNGDVIFIQRRQDLNNYLTVCFLDSSFRCILLELFPFLRCFVGAKDLIRNKTPLS